VQVLARLPYVQDAKSRLLSKENGRLKAIPYCVDWIKRRFRGLLRPDKLAICSSSSLARNTYGENAEWDCRDAEYDRVE
jgi:hypothetical protein